MEIEELPWKAGSGMARGRRRGHFFCVSVGDRIYLRFVPFDGDDEEIVKELGTCLRMIECSARLTYSQLWPAEGGTRC